MLHQRSWCRSSMRCSAPIDIARARATVGETVSVVRLSGIEVRLSLGYSGADELFLNTSHLWTSDSCRSSSRYVRTSDALFRQRTDCLLGIYRCLKHPQYVGIIVITGGMLIECPTLLGLAVGDLDTNVRTTRTTRI